MTDEGTTWLDRLTKVHRLPGTFAAAKAWATRGRRADFDPHELAIIPYQESIMIMRHGKRHWRAWKESGGPICACCARHL